MEYISKLLLKKRVELTESLKIELVNPVGSNNP